ncbi:MAG: hypothetical protein GTO03_10205, partial [Planctomycetales bacterium]|nr:hypothetical protein [Planctomycetales bacterium]
MAQWLGPALQTFATTFAVVAVAGLLLAYLVSAFRHGPLGGLRVVGHYLRQAPVDLINISPRRVLGLTKLAIREALRRRVWIALVLFAAILMFAGWKLNPDTDEPAKLYLNFVLSATTYLMLPIAVFTAAFSLPQDIRNRTIHTITTKPVRASEIVLGRLLGFGLVMTGLVGLMGLASYIFVARGLQHHHQLDPQEMVERQTQGNLVYEGTTSLARRHRHDVRVDGEAFLPELDFAPAADAVGIQIVQVGDAAEASGLAIGDIVLEIAGQPTDAMSRG